MSFSGTKGWNTKPKPGVMLNPLHPLSRGLVGYWLFNEGAGSRADDISGHGNHGILTNMSPNAQSSGWGGSKLGGGLQFDGTNDYIKVVDDTSLKPANFSICFWMKTTQTGNKVILEKDANAGFSVQREANNTPALAVGNNFLAVRTTNTYNDGVWHHVAFVYGTINKAIFVDGINVTTSTQSATPAYSTGPLDIGSRGGAIAFSGSLDNICIYNRVLLAKEIKQLYHNLFCNLLIVPIRRYSVAAPVGVQGAALMATMT